MAVASEYVCFPKYATGTARHLESSTENPLLVSRTAVAVALLFGFAENLGAEVAHAGDNCRKTPAWQLSRSRMASGWRVLPQK